MNNYYLQKKKDIRDSEMHIRIPLMKCNYFSIQNTCIQMYDNFSPLHCCDSGTEHTFYYKEIEDVLFIP